MRIFLSCLIGLLFSTFNSNAQTLQCSRESILQKGGYDVSGRAYLESFDDGTIKLRLDNDFATAPGPDVQIFLSTDSASTNNALRIEDIGTASDGINHFSGAITFDVPTDTDLDQYEWIVIHCVAFNFYWAGGKFEAPICIPNCTAKNIIIDTSLEKDTSIFAMDSLKTNGDIIITKDVTFQAGQSILLNAGFHAQAGHAFSATIGTCSLVEEQTTFTDQKTAARTKNSLLSNQVLKLGLAPNPIVNQSTISYELPVASTIYLALYNMQGQLVQTVIDNEYREGGQHQTQLNVWGGTNGVYFLSLRSQSGLVTKQVLILD